ncbi:MAG: autotransporter domain-containing protein, partial [Elusimicrobiota bacterium]|nr:autotransporter domain-containing protein [Elusimicrobiota bacterium]
MKNTAANLLSMLTSNKILQKIPLIFFAITLLTAFSNVYGADSFLDLKGSHNRDEAVEALLYQSENGNSILYDQVEIVLAEQGEKSAQKTLEALSGVFLVEAIVISAADNNHKRLYEKIHPPNKEQFNFTSSIWLEGESLSAEFDNDASLLGAATNEISGFTLGGNFIARDDIVTGFFMHLQHEDVKQAQSKMFASNTEIGFYGGIFQPYKEWKFHLSVGQSTLKTTRTLVINETVYVPQSTFGLNSVKAGSDIYLPINQKDADIGIKLFAGALAGIVINEEITEDGGELTNLKIDANNYTRADGHAGIKIDGQNQIVRWYIKGEVGYLLYGNNADSEFNITFRDSELPAKKMSIYASQIDPLSYGADGGIEFFIGQQFCIFVDVNYAASKEVNISRVAGGFKVFLGNFSNGGAARPQQRAAPKRTAYKQTAPPPVAQKQVVPAAKQAAAVQKQIPAPRQVVVVQKQIPEPSQVVVAQKQAPPIQAQALTKAPTPSLQRSAEMDNVKKK